MTLTLITAACILVAAYLRHRADTRPLTPRRRPMLRALLGACQDCELHGAGRVELTVTGRCARCGGGATWVLGKSPLPEPPTAHEVMAARVAENKAHAAGAVRTWREAAFVIVSESVH
jgi:hypothetical protein